ncbi:MAG: hypothetical protein II956_13645 [Bacteroidales bacterium]|nr:hypothetical protein [Bacteroidales bacterium]
MKNTLLIPATAIMLVLSACGGKNSNNHNQQSTTPQEEETSQKPAEQKPDNSVVINLVQTGSDKYSCPDIKSIHVFNADSLIISQNGKNFSYTINKDKSCEKIDSQRYKWHFDISRKEPSAPDYVNITIPRYMDDIYGAQNEKDKNFNDECRINDSRDFCLRFDISNTVELTRNIFADHPAPKPFPELQFNVRMYGPAYGADTAAIPEFFKNAETITVKDNIVTVSGKGSATDLDIIPLACVEECGPETCYSWYIMAKKDGVAYTFWINAGTPEKVPNPANRWLSICVRDLANYGETKTKDWNNLKRKICCTYPSEEEYAALLEYEIFDGEEEYCEGDEEVPTPPTPPNVETIKSFLAEKDSNFTNGKFEGMYENVIEFISEPDKNGNVAISKVGWYPAEPSGKKWKIYTIGVTANASDQFKAYMYTANGITDAEVEKPLTRYSKIKQVEMYGDCMFVSTDRFAWNGKNMVKN